MTSQTLFFKISWQSLWWVDGCDLDHDVLENIAAKLVALQKKWYQIALMTWGGNIFRWRKEGKAIDQTIAHTCGMLATCINGLVFAEVIKQLWAQVEVFSAISMDRWIQIFNKEKAVKALTSWKIIICTWGTGNPFNTTDLWSVNRALELDCDILIKCTRVDGVYTADPETDPNATKIDSLTYQEVIERKLNVIDISAVALAMENNLPIYICNMDDIHLRGTDKIKGTIIKD